MRRCKRKLAIETREVYAPLANRLGVWQVKWELEDLAFRYLQPAEYKHIAAALKVRRSERERYIEELKESVAARIARGRHRGQDRGPAQAHLQHLAQDAGQAACLRSAHGHPCGAGAGEQRRRMLCGARHRALALAFHPRRVRRLHRDPEGQSLPLDPHGRHRTRRRSRSRFKSARTKCTRIPSAAWPRTGATRRAAAAIRRTSARSTNCARCLAPAEGGDSAHDFLDRMRVDLFQDRIYVLSPKGEIVDVPVGGTPLDFAYQVHTDLGHRTRGAKVNGRMVGLDYQLKNSETVEIIAAKAPQPSRDWLSPSRASSRARATATRCGRGFASRTNRRTSSRAGRCSIARSSGWASTARPCRSC